MEVIPESIAQYAEAHSSAAKPLLQQLERETWLKHLHPGMVSGHLQGQFLTMISYLLQPKNVLEIGTFTGYSALCLAEGLTEGGTLDTIEVDEELEPHIRNYLKKADLEDKVQLHIGNALDIIPKIDKEFDLVFIDADKVNYSNYYDLVFEKVKKGGLILVDNVLWFGKVLADATDEDTQGIKAFNEKIKEDARVENVLLTIRDGIMMIRKL